MTIEFILVATAYYSYLYLLVYLFNTYSKPAPKPVKKDPEEELKFLYDTLEFVFDPQCWVMPIDMELVNCDSYSWLVYLTEFNDITHGFV